jgi:energy-converting hydrogenase Eha subunit A
VGRGLWVSSQHDLLYYNRPVQKCNLSDPRRALVYVLHRPMVSLLYRDLLTHLPTFPSTFCRKNRWRRSSIPPTPWIPLGLELVIYFWSLSMTMIFNDDSDVIQTITVITLYSLITLYCTCFVLWRCRPRDE